MNVQPAEPHARAGNTNGCARALSPSRLIELGASLANSPPDDVERLAATLVSASDEGRSRSSLNNDGSPLQVSVSLARRGGRPAVRLIGDPAADAADGYLRWHRACRVLSTVLASHAPQLDALCSSLIERTLPTTPAARAALPHGAFWVAADLSGRGMALYATAKWGDAGERWMRTRRWLEEILPASSVACDALDRLASLSALVSAGVEGTEPGNARVKLYWRLGGAAALVDLGIPLFHSAALAEFLDDVVEDRRIPRAGIVGSVGFHVASGTISDVKLDVCGHCVRRTAAGWLGVIERSIARHDLALPASGFAAPLKSTDLAFIGLGLDTEQTPRLNLYFKRSLC